MQRQYAAYSGMRSAHSLSKFAQWLAHFVSAHKQSVRSQKNLMDKIYAAIAQDIRSHKTRNAACPPKSGERVGHFYSKVTTCGASPLHRT
jgi:anaerobic ribonucleoside-triphosphate reductase